MTPGPEAASTFIIVAALLGALIGWALGPIAGRTLRPPREIGSRARWLMVLATAVLFALTVWLVGISPALPAFLVFAAAAVVLGAVDVIEKRLPDAVVLPALVATTLLLAITAAVTGDWASLLGAVLGAAALFALYFLLALISPGGIGMGDVKLAALVGLVLGSVGWAAWLGGALAGFVVGGVVSLLALLMRRVSLRGSLPFGPSMLAGAYLAILLSAVIDAP
ncbi:leader peptidase (prepilin peptidase)/N-methyltransferase [Microterricola gilva]|uniref:Leader peptidase (Prepilin peptidase)/N-methyltransferase n=1 Tax=Microterricola gilva TaxID=393267 RepID=A0A4Q8APP9_9MICO|nr:A24 family peptidase [Microterricola gilva]RZU66670.1 leader peptidase (prepilin peptidase)/N-methyltransferase [Microterricola gilva]